MHISTAIARTFSGVVNTNFVLGWEFFCGSHAVLRGSWLNFFCTTNQV
jgi:hypothetical protein